MSNACRAASGSVTARLAGWLDTQSMLQDASERMPQAA